MLTAAMENNLEVGDIVLYKDFTEARWEIGIYAGYNKESNKNKQVHKIVVGIYPDDEGNPETEKLMILPYRYAFKFNVKKSDINENV